jgi:hypothetical protein
MGIDSSLLVFGGVVFPAAFAAVSIALLRNPHTPVPVLGVLGHRDVATVEVMTVLLPLAILLMPSWLTTVMTLAMVATAWHDVLPRRRRVSTVATPVLVLVTFVALGSDLPATTLANNALLAVVVATTVSLWARMGMRLAHVAHFCAFLFVYDIVFTMHTPIMEALVRHVGEQRIALAVSIPTADGTAFVGLGDMLIVGLAPAVTAYTLGRRRAAQCVVVLVAACTLSIVVSELGGLRIFPMMVTLAPTVVAFAAWVRARQAAPAPQRAHHTGDTTAAVDHALAPA